MATDAIPISFMLRTDAKERGGQTRTTSDEPVCPFFTHRGRLFLDHVDAAVLGPGGFIMALGLGLVFAGADRVDLVGPHANRGQGLLYRVGTPLAESHVVIAAGALLRTVFEHDSIARLHH